MTKRKQELAALFGLGAFFFVEAFVSGREASLPDLPPLALALILGLTAFRGGRAIAYNGIFEWLRVLVGISVSPDTSGAGDSTYIPNTIQGWRRALASLVECPICAGTWVASGALFLYAIDKPMGLAVLYILGAAGIGELCNWMAEHFEWSGRLHRERSGSLWLSKNRPETLRELQARMDGSSLIMPRVEVADYPPSGDYGDLHD